MNYVESDINSPLSYPQQSWLSSPSESSRPQAPAFSSATSLSTESSAEPLHSHPPSHHCTRPPGSWTGWASCSSSPSSRWVAVFLVMIWEVVMAAGLVSSVSGEEERWLCSGESWMSGILASCLTSQECRRQQESVSASSAPGCVRLWNRRLVAWSDLEEIH